MLDLKVKQNFLDRKAITDRVDKSKLKAGNKIGGFVRTTAKRSMRVRKGPSQPGQPPSAHTKLLRDNIFYSWDFATETTVIGPALLKTRNPRAVPINATVPQTLEQGGKVRFNKTRVVKVIKARPYMNPALLKAIHADKLAEAWKDIL